MRGEWVDPIPGDWWTAQGFEFRVDMVQNGEVYFVRFDTSEPPETLGCAGRVTLDDWREVMQIGYKGETLAESEKRIERVFELGFMPFSQLYQPPDANVPTKI